MNDDNASLNLIIKANCVRNEQVFIQKEIVFKPTRAAFQTCWAVKKLLDLEKEFRYHTFLQKSANTY